MKSSSIPVTVPSTTVSDSQPAILASLPDPPDVVYCPQRASIQLDSLLLAIEALDLRASEKFHLVVKKLDLETVVENRLVLWKMRCTNPLRRSRQRRTLTLEEAKAMVLVVGRIASQIAEIIRQLLQDYYRIREKQMPLEQHLLLSSYMERFRKHYRARMNPKRSAVVLHSSDDRLNDLAIEWLGRLLFCTGTQGTQRLWSSLFDGEI